MCVCVCHYIQILVLKPSNWIRAWGRVCLENLIPTKPTKKSPASLQQEGSVPCSQNCTESYPESAEFSHRIPLHLDLDRGISHSSMRLTCFQADTPQMYGTGAEL